jgi:hypothetical protein
LKNTKNPCDEIPESDVFLIERHVAVVHHEELVSLPRMQTSTEAITEDADRHALAGVVSVMAKGAVYVDHEEAVQ